MAFAVLSFSQIAHTFNMRGGALFSRERKGSRLLPAALLCGGLQCAVLLFPPLAGLFDAASLNAEEWLAVIGFSLAPAAIGRAQGGINRRRSAA